MKERITQNWTLQRALFVIVGLVFAVNAIIDAEWIILLFGLYLTSMGIFSFDCASGACGTTPIANIKTQETEDLEYEEIK